MKIKSAIVTVDGKTYRVIENLPYHGCGRPSKFVETKDGEKVVVKEGGMWRFWTAKDRLGKT